MMRDTVRLGFGRCIRVYRVENVGVDDTLRIYHATSEILKVTRKSTVRRSGEWVIKENSKDSWGETAKHVLLPARYRRAWLAANYLLDRGIHVPPPLAMLEFVKLGCVFRTAIICRFMAEYESVRSRAQYLVRHCAAPKIIEGFLLGLADAVNCLFDGRAVHADLSGKNILTGAGETFCFIDLDSVRINVVYSEADRIKNHVQLYDTFCDILPEELLDTFVARLARGVEVDKSAWLERVKTDQAERAHRREQRGGSVTG